MRILHLSWEYPPLVYGGLGRHVHALAHAQAAEGHDVIVLTAAESATPTKPSLPPEATFADDVGVIRVRSDAPPLTFDHDLVGWVTVMEHALIRAGLRLQRDWEPDVIHGHDWMVAHAGVALRDATAAPLTATIHATESGRHQGCLDAPEARAINAIENWLAGTCDALTVCSHHMQAEVAQLFGLEPGRIRVIPNGIDAQAWLRDDAAALRMRQKLGSPQPLLVYSGRVEYEKGIHNLLVALGDIRRDHPQCLLAISGQGSQAAELARYAGELGVAESVRFAGWLPEDDLHALVAAADLAVIPSIYEPFGLVALEAAALGTPLVVAATGGLAEFAGTRQERARTFHPGDPADLTRAVLAALADPADRWQRARAAQAALSAEYNWQLIARRVVDLYRAAGAEGHLASSDSSAAGWNLFARGHGAVPTTDAR